ncbi:MAG: methylmalonyl Co-A mutase-associated GTPase MeaB [Gemmatimonadetes bacterium]|nr:methylmalonyl Co-A mutase-associated GTPase MeaB [Gemmatimonadota bacterium]
MPNIDELIAGVKNNDIQALARAISTVEDRRPGFEALLSGLHPDVGSAYRVGITGSPGVGKSTLIEQLVRAYRDTGLTVAVVAVDPTSPFTGGALLGDRIRMKTLSSDDGVFIRSMATRGAPGGLAMTTREVCDVLDAFGFERIIVETVGVGQSELAIAHTADTAVLVMMPESGDGVQLLKAGVMEIADAYVVNKGDRPGAEALMHEIRSMLDIRASIAADAAPIPAWNPPVLRTVAIEGEGIDEVREAIENHAIAMRESGLLEDRRRARLREHTREVVERAVVQALWQGTGAGERLAGGVEEVLSGERSPYDLANAIIADTLETSVD